MKTYRRAIESLRLGVCGLACLSFLAACATPLGRPAPIALRGAQAAVAAGAPSGEVGRAEIVVRLSEDKRRSALPSRRLASVDLARATAITVRVTGAGINGWQTVASSSTFGAPDVNGIRTATFTSTTVPAGARRVFKVEVKDGSTLLEELWGVADVPAAATTTVTVTRAGTPTAKIFRKLIATRNAPQALGLNIAAVQGFVDKLLNTDSATGDPIDGAKPKIDYSLLNVDLAANAIALGEGGQSFTVPATVPASLVPTPVRRAQIQIKALDIKGLTTTSECVVFVSDPASPVVRTTTGNPVDVTLPDITPGTWTASVIDLANGRQASITVTLAESESKVVTVTLPPQDVDVMIGAYNLESSQPYGYNGDGIHPALAYLNDPQALAISGSMVYFVDTANKRIRSMDLASNAPVVQTVAGNGVTATVVAAENADALQVPVNADTETHLSFDENGNLLFTERTFKRVAKLDKTTGKLTTFIKTADIPGWNASREPGPLYYHAPSRTLYLGSFYILSTDLFAVNMATFPAAGSAVKVTPNFAGGVIREGDYLFYGCGYSSYKLMRRTVSTGVEATMVGKNQIYQNGNGVPAQDLYNYSGSGGAAWDDFALDANGNFYCTNRYDSRAIYRITDALNGDDTVNNWLANNLKVSNPAALAEGLVIDPATGNLIFSGTGSVPNPNGSSSVNVDAINLLRP